MKNANFQGNRFAKTGACALAANGARWVAGLFFAAGLSGCSFEASITAPEIPSITPTVSLNRADTDFLSGEVVTTKNGTTIRAVFGEVAEKRILSSGHEIEGVVQ